jgi:hypothetical protein
MLSVGLGDLRAGGRSQMKGRRAWMEGNVEEEGNAGSEIVSARWPACSLLPGTEELTLRRH